MLSEATVRDIIAAWRAVWDPFVEPQVSTWCEALSRAGMTDDTAVGLNSAFLMQWAGSTAPKLGHLLSWLRNRPKKSPGRLPPQKQRKRTPEEEAARRKAAQEMFARMRHSLNRSATSDQ